MSWLFGKKKHQKDSPSEVMEEELSSTTREDGFISIERRNPRSPSNPTVGECSPYPEGGLYPFMGGMPTYPAVAPADSPKQHQQGDALHYLSGVPFKLCKRLEMFMEDDLEVDKLRVAEILSFIERLENQKYDYEFSVEESVVAEMNSGSGE
ncbi:hypothetical protein KM043_001805 [Ampulex compressa]|nr:hypothetical protein KM043_001805 [Ampulex compressa]